MLHGKNIFLLVGLKVDCIAPCEANKSILLPTSRKKSCTAWKKHLYYSFSSPSNVTRAIFSFKKWHIKNQTTDLLWISSPNQCIEPLNENKPSIQFETHREQYFVLLSGHKVDFIAPCRENISIFWPPSGTKIVCNTGKTFFC